MPERGQVDPGHPVREGAGHLARHGQGQAGLADPPGTGQGQQPDLLPAQASAERGHLPLPPHQPGRRQRQRRQRQRRAAARRGAGSRLGRRGQLGPGGGDQRGTRGGVEREGIGQQPHRLGAGHGAVAGLQGADAARTEPGALRQLLLAEAGHQPQAAQQGAEGIGGGCGHGVSGIRHPLASGGGRATV